MSVEATALSRSKLEQKDRSELAAIVEAMGGKAGSRAKKADLVDLVLELAGASPTPRSERRHRRDAERVDERRRCHRATPRRADADPARRAGAARRRARRPSGSSAVASEPADAEPPTDAAATTTDAPATAGRTAAPATHRSAESHGGQSQGDRRRSRATGSARRRRAGNRRRRRRGRDRDRDRDRERQRDRQRRPARGAVHRRARRGRGLPRPARRGLRLPAPEGLPSVEGRRVRVGQAGAPVRSAQGRLPEGREPSGVAQREEPGAAAHRLRQRDGSRAGAQPPQVRGPHAAVPGREAQDGAGRRSRRT